MSATPRKDVKREQDMATMFLGGATLQEIGNHYGLTRERVRQLIKRHGASRANGGIAIKAARRNHATNLARTQRLNDRAMRSYGCDYDTAKRLCGGLSLCAKGSPARLYKAQQHNAKSRGVEWAITFPEWVRVWDESGRWADRGLGLGRYVMARRGDVGPYAPWNVYIVESGENIRHGYAFRRLRKSQEAAA